MTHVASLVRAHRQLFHAQLDDLLGYAIQLDVEPEYLPGISRERRLEGLGL